MSKNAVLTGIAVAESMVKDFIEHPEFRGQKFSWENLPELCARFAGTGFHHKYHHSRAKTGEVSKRLREIAADAARDRATQMLRERGLLPTP